MTYPLGWAIVTQTLVRRERWPGGLKLKATPLVRPGEEVQPDQPVLRFQNPAALASEKVGPSRESARGEHLSGSNGLYQGETIPAGLRGRVVDITPRGGVVIESRAALVQGALGAGSQVAGVLTFWQAPGRAQPSTLPGAILVVPGPLNLAMLQQAAGSGAVGVVASSTSSRDLENFLHADLVQLIGDMNTDAVPSRLPPLTLLFTEGLGTLPMPAPTIDLLTRYQGSVALLSGTTFARQAIFPELVISLPQQESAENWHPVHPDPLLTIGARVRVCSGEYEGAIGEINHLFTHQQVFSSGIRARAARLQLEDGSLLVLPLAVIERIG